MRLLPLVALSTTLSAALFACDSPPKMRVESATVATGGDVLVSFDEPLAGRATNQYWVALQPAGAPESDTTGRVVLERSDRSVRLRTAAPGDFEVRLHGSYPKEEHHLLVRIPVKVEGWPVKTGSEPKASVDECLDRWLAAEKLDAYGSPEGTVYAGGSPLLDEATGTATSRWDYVVAKHPGLARTCDAARGPAR
jgi:hypothetical protein